MLSSLQCWAIEDMGGGDYIAHRAVDAFCDGTTATVRCRGKRECFYALGWHARGLDGIRDSHPELPRIARCPRCEETMR